MLKERLSGSEIARRPVCTTTQLWKFDPISVEDREYSLIIKLATKWIKKTSNPNTGFSVTPYGVTISWIDSCIYSLVVNIEEGFVILHADCATPDVAEMIDNICGMLTGVCPFYSSEEVRAL